ncbi:MAG: hypothetical protein ACXVEF_25550 [Polyangiales bacterium]
MKTGALVLAALALSCSSKSDTPASTSLDLTIDTGEFEVGVGDTFECFYTDAHTPARDLGITGALGRQGAGGHHITVYYTDIENPVGHHPCKEDEMVQWRQVAGADQLDATGSSGEPQFQMPDGYAYKMPAGKQILLQVHYVNATGKPMKVSSEVTVKLVDPSSVKTWINHYQSSFEAFTIPAKKDLTSSSTCVVKDDISAFLLTGHMHEWGKHYKLERVDETGASLETIYEKDWEASFSSHPPTLRWSTDAPYKIAKGTLLRQTCTWQNDTDADIIFPKEMCVFFGFYFPDKGEIECEKVVTK